MPTKYLPPVNLGYNIGWYAEKQISEPIMEGPTFVRTSRSGRWHMIRAGVLRLSEHHPNTIKTTYELWCGQWASDFQGLMERDVVPDGEPVCGRCHGASLGANPDHPEFIFLPRTLRRPKVCPSSRTRDYREDPDHWNRGWCLVCGEYVKLRAFGGPWNGGWGAQRHEPGPGLVDPCPFHGWKELTCDDNGARCRCGEKGIKL